MTYMAQLSTLIEDVFGEKTSKLADRPYRDNVITSSLFREPDSAFLDVFRQRLCRLNALYKDGDNRKNILDQVNLLGSPTWDGAYSELVAFDYLNSEIMMELYNEPIDLNVDISNSRTFASNLGKPGDANLDGHYQFDDIYFDVKCFKNNVDDILWNIYEHVRGKTAGHNRVKLIQAEYDFDRPYEALKGHIGTIRTDLEKATISSNPPAEVKIPGLSGISFYLRQEAGVYSTLHEYNPYQHAETSHLLAFNYVNKFVKDRPSFLVYVVLPWISRPLNLFPDDNEVFYRAFSRRAFCQYKNDSTPASHFIRKFKGAETISEISSFLSGIWFIEDHSLDEREGCDRRAKSFLYSNPNAKNKICASVFSHYMEKTCSGLDTFDFDNY